MKRYALTVALFFLVTVVFGGQTIPVHTKTRITVKVLAMDRNNGRYGNPVAVGVSSAAAYQAFKQGSFRVRGRRVVPYRMKRLADARRFRVLFIDTNWAGFYQAVSSIAKQNKAIVICINPAPVEQGLATVSFQAIGGKARIMLNLTHAKQVGCSFSARFLKITRVVGGLR